VLRSKTPNLVLQELWGLRFELRLLQSSRRAVASEWLAMSASRSLQVLPVHMRAKLSS
jgi:hypothetical protein